MDKEKKPNSEKYAFPTEPMKEAEKKRTPEEIHKAPMPEKYPPEEKAK